MEATNSSLLCSRVLFSVSRRSGPPFTHLPSSSNVNRRFLCSVVRSSARYAILGAGFAGLSVAWHLLQHSSKESGMSIDIYDESDLGGGASGISGGLLHPYSPKGKLLWRGSESWEECLKLLAAAERALELSYSSKLGHDQSCSFDGPIILRRGILRPGTTETNVEILKALLECSKLPHKLSFRPPCWASCNFSRTKSISSIQFCCFHALGYEYSSKEVS